MNRTAETIFKVGLIIKGVDSLFEVLGGLLLTMPTKLARVLLVLAHHELYRHHDVLAGKLDRLADEVTVQVHLGSALYLLVHGLAKVILIAAVFKGKQWGYLGLIGVLSIFSAIEMVRVVTAQEYVTGVLGLFDIAVVVLMVKEYRQRFGANAVRTN